MIKNFIQDENGMSLTEAAILFPILLSLIMAVYDLGQGVIVNQKTIMASQVVADLVARYEVLDLETVNDIATAGELSLQPYSTASFGYDITSIEFDEDDNPAILWRVTNNMDAVENVIEATMGLGEEGDGVVAVSVNYRYVPFFSNFVFDEINMNERAFLRGRKSATVLCDDC